MTAGMTVEHISNDWYEPISAVANEDFTLWLEWLREAHIHLMAERVCVSESEMNVYELCFCFKCVSLQTNLDLTNKILSVFFVQ